MIIYGEISELYIKFILIYTNFGRKLKKKNEKKLARKSLDVDTLKKEKSIPIQTKITLSSSNRKLL